MAMLTPTVAAFTAQADVLPGIHSREEGDIFNLAVPHAPVRESSTPPPKHVYESQLSFVSADYIEEGSVSFGCQRWHRRCLLALHFFLTLCREWLALATMSLADKSMP